MGVGDENFKWLFLKKNLLFVISLATPYSRQKAKCACCHWQKLGWDEDPFLESKWGLGGRGSSIANIVNTILILI